MTTPEKGGRRRRLGWSTSSFSIRLGDSSSKSSATATPNLSRKSMSSSAASSSAVSVSTTSSVSSNRTRHQELLEALKDIGETSEAASVLAEHKLATLTRLEATATLPTKRHIRAPSIFGRRRSESHAPAPPATSQKSSAARDPSRRHGRIEPATVPPSQRHLKSASPSPLLPCTDLDLELAQKQRANAKILEELSDLVCLATAQRYNRDQLEQEQHQVARMAAEEDSFARAFSMPERFILPSNLSTRNRLPSSTLAGGLVAAAPIMQRSPSLDVSCTSPMSSSLDLPHTLELALIEGLEPVPLAPLLPRRAGAPKLRARSKSHGPGSRPAAAVAAAATVPLPPTSRPTLRRAPSDISQETPRASQASKLEADHHRRERTRRPIPPLPAGVNGAVLAAVAASAARQASSHRDRPSHGTKRFDDAHEEPPHRSPGEVSSAASAWYSAVSKPGTRSLGRQRALSHASSSGSTLFGSSSAAASLRSRDSASTLTSRESFLSLSSHGSSEDNRLRFASSSSSNKAAESHGGKEFSRSFVPTPTFGVIAEGQLPVFPRRRTFSEASVEALAAYDPRPGRVLLSDGPYEQDEVLRGSDTDTEILLDDEGRFDDATSPDVGRRPPSSGMGSCLGTTSKSTPALSSQLASLNVGCNTRPVGLGLMV